MKTKIKCIKQLLTLFLCAFLLVLTTVWVYGASIVNSKHDLSSTSGGAINEICVICHTPHAGDSTDAPLWNRQAPTSTFTMYGSLTIDTVIPGVPNGESLVCLSCHDGVSGDAHQALVNSPGSGLAGNGDVTTCTQGCHYSGWNPITFVIEFGTRQGVTIVGTDLSDDHPISMPYPIPSQDPNFQLPAVAEGAGVKLFGSTDTVECSSCHNVHDPEYSPFLSIDNAGSDLCYACHIK